AGAQAAISSGLKASDSRRLLALIPWASAASPLQERYLAVSRAGTRLTTRVVGVTPDYQPILRLSVGRGRFLSPLDERNVERVWRRCGGAASEGSRGRPRARAARRRARADAAEKAGGAFGAR